MKIKYIHVDYIYIYFSFLSLTLLCHRHFSLKTIFRAFSSEPLKYHLQHCYSCTLDIDIKYHSEVNMHRAAFEIGSISICNILTSVLNFWRLAETLIQNRWGRNCENILYEIAIINTLCIVFSVVVFNSELLVTLPIPPDKFVYCTHIISESKHSHILSNGLLIQQDMNIFVRFLLDHFSDEKVHSLYFFWYAYSLQHSNSCFPFVVVIPFIVNLIWITMRTNSVPLIADLLQYSYESQLRASINKLLPYNVWWKSLKTLSEYFDKILAHYNDDINIYTKDASAELGKLNTKMNDKSEAFQYLIVTICFLMIMSPCHRQIVFTFQNCFNFLVFVTIFRIVNIINLYTTENLLYQGFRYQTKISTETHCQIQMYL